jgi:hypothetical protein
MLTRSRAASPGLARVVGVRAPVVVVAASDRRLRDTRHEPDEAGEHRPAQQGAAHAKEVAAPGTRCPRKHAREPSATSDWSGPAPRSQPAASRGRSASELDVTALVAAWQHSGGRTTARSAASPRTRPRDLSLVVQRSCLLVAAQCGVGARRTAPLLDPHGVLIPWASTPEDRSSDRTA